MSEEEKKAINRLKLLNRELYIDNCNLVNVNDLSTVLNLIAKQQNRIEKLKHSIEIILSELPEDMDYKAIEKLLED